MQRRSFFFLIFALVLSISAGSIGSTAVMPVDERIQPNELGRIPILEYHQVGPKEDRWTRSFENFRKDLEWLYNNDYRAVSILDFANQRIDIPYGKKPVIFTFDDGGYTQLNFKNGKIDPYTAIGVMDDFLRVHPDFGSAAVFYVNANPFKLVNDKKKALEYLFSSGRQLGNHTFTHANLSKLNADGVDRELSRLDTYVRGLGFKDADLTTLAYPFGGVPKGSAATSMRKYSKLGLLVGADPANVPYHAKYDPYFVPRIQAIDDEWKRWFKRKSGETGKSFVAPVFVPYVSDGDPDKITIPNGQGLNRANVRKGVTVSLYKMSLDKRSDIRSSVEEGEMQEMSVVLEALPEPKKFIPAKKDDKENKKIASENELFPYKACKDPDADMYIQYKKTGTLTNVADMSSDNLLNWYRLTTFPGAAVRWIRATTNPDAIRGIYFTGSTATSDIGKRLTEKLLAAGGNAIVFDINESEGALTYGKPDQKLLLKDLKPFIQEWNSNGIYTIARIVAFKDRVVSRARKDLAIRSSGGGTWTDNKGSVWLDPSNPQTVQYVIDMAKEAAAMGVDEVQFDYVRFPTEGNLGAARFMFDHTKKQKWEVIRDFLKEARRQLAPTGVKLSADIFGIVGWQKGYDAKTTGQKIECIAPYLDVIYPMGYPSHFGPGFGGHKNPADEPYFFTWRTAQYFADYAKGTGAAIRPWLQAFTYRVTIPYNSAYISEQMRGAFAAGGDGFVLWNAGNAYDVAWGVIGK